MSEPNRDDLDDLVTDYIDRLAGGERIDPESILLAHPDSGPAILEELRVYLELEGVGPREVGARPLGVLGDYTLRSQVGRGGMGVVYDAWQGSMDRRVALKVLPKAVAVDTKAVTRFIREAQLAGKLSHPNIVHVHGMGVEEQVPYYAMEFVEGETLAQVLARLKAAEGKDGDRETVLQGISGLFESSEALTAETEVDPEGLPPDRKALLQPGTFDLEYYARLAKAFAGAADGLRHAHSKGIIHRDIKPSNLILDRDGRLRILDFGLARLAGQEGLTLSGDFVGTPLYMSPEQARRKRITIDYRTDLYSTGATVYEMLTLRPPFEGKDHQDTLSQIIERDPVEPRKFNPRVPRDLETIVLKCLRKDPADRYGTAEALAQDLRRFARGEPIEARAQSKWERLSRKIARRRLQIAGAAVVLAALGALGWQVVAWKLETSRRIERAYEEEVVAAALRLEMASLPQRAKTGDQPFWGGSSGSFARTPQRDPVEEARKSLEEARALLPGRADARYHLARALILLGKSEEAQRILEGLISASPPFVPAITLKADVLWERGEREQAKSLVGEAGRLAPEGWEKAWVEVWKGWKAKRYPELVESYSRLLELASSGREPFLGSALLARLGRGQAALKAKDFIQALKDFNTAEFLVPGAAIPALLSGKAWFEVGKKDLAELVFLRLFERAELKDEVAGAIWGIYDSEWGDQEKALYWAGRITVPSIREARRCTTLYWLGRAAEAEEAGRKALEGDPQDPGVYENVGFILTLSGKQAEAREVLEKGIRRHPDFAESYSDLGFSYMKDPGRDMERATLNLEKAVELGADPTNSAHLGQCYFWKGDRQRALEMLRKAAETGSESSAVFNQSGIALSMAGLLPEGIASFDHAIELNPLFSLPHANKGFSLFLQGRLDESLVSLRNAKDLLPRLNNSFTLSGRALELQGKAGEAIGAYAEAIAVNPGDLSGHARLAHLLPRAGKSASANDLDQAARVLERALETSRRSEPENLAWVSSSLAIVLAARGGAGGAERALEILLPVLETAGTSKVLLPRLLEDLRAVLEAYSGDAPGGEPLALLPSLPPYQAIDAALSIEPHPRDVGAILERFRSPADGTAARDRLLYLEGSLLAKRGDLPRSIAKLEELARRDAASPEPVLRLAEVLRLWGQPDLAAEALRAALEGPRGKDRRLWDLWLAVELVDLDRPAREVLESLPAASGGPAPDGDYPGDVAWLLERCANGEPLRIRSGGGEYQEPGGRLWGKDRFALGGKTSSAWGGDILDTDADPLYRTERYFPLEEAGERSAYAIPLPPGTYRVHLHFAEVYQDFPEFRRFDVLLEGKKVLDDFDSMKAGFATKIEEVFDTAVIDGLLEVRFVHRPALDVPKVSAIEVEKIDQ